MSVNWVADINRMQGKYGTRDWVNDEANAEKLREFLAFRIDFLDEELNETKDAFNNKDPEEVVDGLIDLCVIAIGTLDAFGVSPYAAWDEVLRANMQKEIGVKETRPNKLGLPDLVKPEGWEGPSHEGNHGTLDKAFK
jgi:hypothetical protein